MQNAKIEETRRVLDSLLCKDCSGGKPCSKHAPDQSKELAIDEWKEDYAKARDKVHFRTPAALCENLSKIYVDGIAQVSTEVHFRTESEFDPKMGKGVWRRNFFDYSQKRILVKEVQFHTVVIDGYIYYVADAPKNAVHTLMRIDDIDISQVD